MKQLETRNQNLIANVLNFYREIGIESIISDNNFYKETFSSINNKKDTRQKQNHYEQKNRELQIKELENSFKNFEGCKLRKTSTKFVSFYGNSNSKLLIVDGPPDHDEDKKGVSFISSKGLLFEKMLNSIQLKIDETFIVKSIPWRPPGNRHPSSEEIKICRPFILNLVKLIKPYIILCLGEVPTKQILGLNENITKIRGQWKTLKFNEFNYELLVLPTFNISHLLERPDLKRHAWKDLKLLRDKIKEIQLRYECCK